MTEWAVFAKVRETWHFEGFRQHEETVTDFVDVVEAKYGEGSAFVVELPEVKK